MLLLCSELMIEAEKGAIASPFGLCHVFGGRLASLTHEACALRLVHLRQLAVLAF